MMGTLSADEFLMDIPDTELIDALINQESRGNNKAVSKKGARGLAQVMPATAKNPGYGVQPLRDDSPEEARRFATDYLGAMLKKYGGNTELALAAYNAGPGAVDAHKGVPPFPETRNYVSKIMAALNPISNAQAADDAPKSADDFLADIPDAKPTAGEAESSGLGRVAGLGGRAIIEGVSAIPGGVYNAVSTIGNLPKTLITGNAHESDAVGLPTHIDTQKYGTKLADLLSLPQPTEAEAIPMDVARMAAGWGAAGPLLKAAGAAPKLLEMAGVSRPVLAGAGAAAGTGAADIARENGLPPAAQIALAIAANMGVSGAAKAGKYIIDPAERGASAMVRSAKETAAKLNMAGIEPERMVNLTQTADDFVPGALPTAAMKYNDPVISDAETMARLRNKEAFAARDEVNQRIVYDALKGKAGSGDAQVLLKALNDRTTPIREEAINLARQSGGYEKPLIDRIDDIKTAPGTRYNGQLGPLIRPAERIIESGNIDPLDLYAYRKQLADSLNSKAPMTMDEMTNAAKNSRREATILKESVDEGINKASGGKWEEYLKAHREGMKPINEVEAWQEVLGRFNNAGEIAPDIPRITPHALRKAISGETFNKSGRDLLSADGRVLANQLKNTLNAMERARSPRAAINGSQTAPLLAQATKSLLANKPGIRTMTGILKELGRVANGNNALDDALLNPDKLERLIETAIRNKNDTFLRSLRDAVVRSSGQEAR